jgi:hypothetical protein
MKRLSFAFLCFALALLAASCASTGSPYDQPYSIIVTDTLPQPDSLLRPVIVNRVDGETIIDNRAVVPPGRHQVVLDVPPRAGFHSATQRTLVLDTAPCTRYYVMAKLETPITQEWTPIVRYDEPIGECRSKFGVGGR